MCTNNKQSLEINYDHLKVALPTIAMWIALESAIIMPELCSIAYRIACRRYKFYREISPEVYVKIKNLPILDKLRDLRYSHLGKMIRVNGVVTARSEVFNQLKRVVYKCTKCGYEKGPFYLNSVNSIRLGQCSSCQSTGPFPIEKSKTIYRNYQKITIQESPNSVLPGRIPRSKEIVLIGDNIDVVRPGDEVDITGIYNYRYEIPLNIKQGFPIFVTLIEANYVSRLEESQMEEDDLESEAKYRKFAKSENLDERIFGSIAPSIYGH